ncbi:MAG: carbamoyltransferase HypF [Bacteroidota bacterium]|nr:carbamoyltransferase HypF [Bacteroidota bacterium]
MHTYHIHIKGLVQGVGFRPYVCRIAEAMHLTGWVNNTTDGVHVEITTDESTAYLFYHQITAHPPANALITSHVIKEVSLKKYAAFTIADSTAKHGTDLLLTPDIAVCPDCLNEINDNANRRHGYAFTTCLNCGPRYSIIQSLPYDRINTTMASLAMCNTCTEEYHNIYNRRHYSQTNSCPNCAIHLHVYISSTQETKIEQEKIIPGVVQSLCNGKIIAMKGIGGYLLLCDATSENTILQLRERKHRPAKPFAVLYADITMASADVQLRPSEIEALKSKAAPIVLCKKKSHPENNIAIRVIAPGLDKIGVVLPYAPLLYLLSHRFGKPLIATSANISGSPILYTDEQALENLFDIADEVITYDRTIVMPQDDSVLQFTERGQKIILRRSRGLSPNYYPHPFPITKETIWATGGELKSAFAIQHHDQLYVSQFLGDQGTVESQESYTLTADHLFALLQIQPQKIIVDAHPAYAVTLAGTALAEKLHLQKPMVVQHHKAHFAAVLAENNLLQTQQPVLGFVWDGTGYGEDNNIWGSEVFVYQHHQIKRVAHLKYFPQLIGDKMSKEPRLSALSLLQHFPSKQQHLQKYFSATEWEYYQKLLQQNNTIYTSSMGRFLDGLACLLGIRIFNSYEGEAAMQLEALARNCSYKPYDAYALPLVDGELDWTVFLHELMEDWQQKEDVSLIAWKIFYSLAKAITQLSNHFFIDHLAFSGGVFQNALLTDLVIEQLSKKRHLYFHQQLSPNDECIGFGQIAYYHIEQQAAPQETAVTSQKIISSIL